MLKLLRGGSDATEYVVNRNVDKLSVKSLVVAESYLLFFFLCINVLFVAVNSSCKYYLCKYYLSPMS